MAKSGRWVVSDWDGMAGLIIVLLNTMTKKVINRIVLCRDHQAAIKLMETSET